ncbi:MAG: DsbC family protein, partial [Mariprofundus sp.]|nr:DsbC family protein [Mariprofundus sp.]
MRTILLMISIMLSSFSMPAIAADNAAVDSKTAQQIRKALATVPIVAIKSSVIPHLYELQVGNQIFYSDASGRYLMRGGHILDMQEQKDLTQQRLEDINRVDWSSLPLDKAIVSGDTKAKKSIAIFTDPECPYCKGLEKTLKDVKGVKVYTFLFPLTSIHPNARAKAEGIWCSKDQHKMLQRVMLEDFVPKATTCDTPIDAIAKVAA